MSVRDPEFLTAKELAELLRIGERKVYDLAASGEVPCVRAVGKLLFPRKDIIAWIDASRSGQAAAPQAGLPEVMAGSHDPLLDWALRQSECGFAALFDGSFDGLERFAAREAAAAAIHISDREGWNTETVASEFGAAPVVLVSFCTRQRGLILPPGNPAGVQAITGLANKRLAIRQPGAASQRLLETLLAETFADGRDAPKHVTPACRTEDELALAVLDGRAEAAFGLAAVARRFRLEFVPVVEEQFDLLVWRRAYFEPPMQRFLAFCRGDTFVRQAADLGGYDVGGLGDIRFNGQVG